MCFFNWFSLKVFGTVRVALRRRKFCETRDNCSGFRKSIKLCGAVDRQQQLKQPAAVEFARFVVNKRMNPNAIESRGPGFIVQSTALLLYVLCIYWCVGRHFLFF